MICLFFENKITTTENTLYIQIKTNKWQSSLIGCCGWLGQREAVGSQIHGHLTTFDILCIRSQKVQV